MYVHVCFACGKLMCYLKTVLIYVCFAFDFFQGLNGQKKYQIHLKSTSGPIDVLLVNKDTWSSPPVVLPVPPPEDLIQCQAAAPSKPQIPPLAHFQEASVPSSTQPSTPTPTSTQDHGPPTQKNAGTGERELQEAEMGWWLVEEGTFLGPVWAGTAGCTALRAPGKGASLPLLLLPFLWPWLVGLAVLREIRHLASAGSASLQEHL